MVNVRVGGNCVEVLRGEVTLADLAHRNTATVAALSPMARPCQPPECHWRARYFTDAAILFSIHLALSSPK